MQYYICVGLGVWLMEKAFLYADPAIDLTFLQEIGNFLLNLALWPISIIGNAFKSHKIRQQIAELDEHYKTLLAARDAVESNDDQQGQG